MKVSLNWLREWVAPDVDAETLAARLSLAGLESEAAPMLSRLPSQMVVGRIAQIAAHPDADRLRVCQVDVGGTELQQIVCGAPNAAAGLLVPAALPGAELPGGIKIKRAKLRGVESAGMLCSASELGLAEKSAGLMPLPGDAVPGTAVTELLNLDDHILELELTPNRGDCLSLRGLARECGAVFGVPVRSPDAKPVAVTSERSWGVSIAEPASCSRYAGRVVEGIDPAATTPLWMVEKLRRSGIRTIHPVVDITNYVMLELGQPMHAFDCAKLDGAIAVRAAQPGEQLELLNEQTVTLNHGELLIADQGRPLALAGVMGGEQCGVDAATTDVFLESARFAPAAVAGTGRRHKLHSDALHRFERDVDPELQLPALERATELLLAICGGRAGAVTDVAGEPVAGARITLRSQRLQRLLGVEIPAAEVERLLGALGLEVADSKDGAWSVAIPSFRPDLRIEADLIEEVARLYGYARISAAPYNAALAPQPVPEHRRSEHAMADLLAARGWQQTVTYAFVDAGLQAQLTEAGAPIALDNPIAETMAVMRLSLWPGLIQAWRHNAQRQQRRLRLFEAGVCFEQDGSRIEERAMLAGLAVGPVWPEHWDQPAREVDFYDIKGELEVLVGCGLQAERASHPALHPGKAATLSAGGRRLGVLGELHPGLRGQLDLPANAVLFELDLQAAAELAVPQATAVPEQPWSRRDLALVVAESVSAAQISEAATAAGAAHLARVQLFDIYRGKGLPDACKSVALGLIFQDYSRTLTDQEVDQAVQQVVSHLKNQLGAELRG